MTTWIGTSWKMNKTQAEAVEFASDLRRAEHEDQWEGVQPFLLPSLTSLSAVASALGPETSIILGAQNAHWADSGPWTGETSVVQVADAGARLVEIGHSERRAHFAETDHTVNLKVRAALRHGLTPLVCVGESAEARRGGEAIPYVLTQISKALHAVADTSPVLIAYEPIWAIGEGGRSASPDEVAPILRAIHSRYRGQFAGILYGGSVTADNAATLLAVPGINGLFVGRSAWDVHGFLELLTIAHATELMNRNEPSTSAGRSAPADPTENWRSDVPIRS